MCGRFTMTVPSNQLRECFPLFELPDSHVRYNIAPTQDVLAVRHKDGAARGILMRWGLVPSWADDVAIGNRLINARAESVAEKPAFRAAFLKRRCLVLADGFYEWQKRGKKGKQPFHFHRKDHAPFAFAGLWEFWKAEDGVNDADAESEPGRSPRIVRSCTIITTDANDLVAPFHDRMPVILGTRDYERWLDPSPVDPAIVREMLRPYPADQMAVMRANKRVNSPQNDDEECLRPEPELETHEEQTLF